MHGNHNSRRMPLVRSLTYLTCSASVLAFTPAFAQQAAPQSADPSEHFGIEEIIVTAQRRSESSQKTPVSISALDDRALERIGFQRPNDIASVVPNVQVSEVYGHFQPIFTIRGIGQSDYNANQTSPIGIYADEAYIGPVFLHGSNFFDIERVEVLRGPQGTLYGKNTTGGAINLISKQPDLTGDIAGEFKGSYGNYNAVAIDGAIQTPIVQDRLAARVAFTFGDDDGYQHDLTNRRKLARTHFWGTRATVRFVPVDGFEGLLRYTHTEMDQVGAAPRTEGTIPIPGLGNVDVSGYQRPAGLGFYDREDNFTGPLKVKSDFLTLNMTLNLGSLDIVSTSSAINGKNSQRANLDGSPLRLLDYEASASNRSYSQDLRLVTNDWGDFKLIAGAYYGYQRDKTHTTYFAYDSPLAAVRAVDPAFASLLEQFGAVSNRQTIVRESLAAYSQLRWDVTPKWGVDIGLRFTRDLDKQPYHNISRLDANGNPIGSYVPGNISLALLGVPIDSAFVPPMPGLPNGLYLDGPYTTTSDAPLRVRNNRVTGKLGLDYKPTSNLMVYASYSLGYRSGNFLGGNYYYPRTLSDGVYAKPETVDALEVGLKSDLLDRRLRLNATMFQYDYKNQQFINVVGISNVLENAGKSRIRGVEFEATVQPIENLTLQGSVSYLDAKFLRLLLGDPTTSFTTPIDLSGNQLISSPKYNATFGADYILPLERNFVATFHVDGSYRSRQWFSAYNGKVGYSPNQQKGYTLVNGRLGIANTQAGYNIDLWVKNIFDEKYDSYSINLNNAFGLNYFMSGAPRTFGVELAYRF